MKRLTRSSPGSGSGNTAGRTSSSPTPRTLTWAPASPGRAPSASRMVASTRYRTREEFLDQIRAIVRQDIVDIMLMSASNMERLSDEGLFKDSPVKPAIRANDTSDIWRMRGATPSTRPSRPFRSASIPRTMYGTATPMPGAAITGPTSASTRLPSITTSTPTWPRWKPSPPSAPRPPTAASRASSRCSTPTSTPESTPRPCPTHVNDNILRRIAGVHQADRPQFLKIVYNGPKALEELILELTSA